MNGLSIAVVLGSVREGRAGERVGLFLVRRLAELGHKPILVDPFEHPLPILVRRYFEYEADQAPDALVRLAAIFRHADAIIAASAEYNHSIPPALSNMLDHFSEEFHFKPAGIACYSSGRFGGVRAAMQLRALLGELHMPTIPPIFPVPQVTELLDENGFPFEASTSGGECFIRDAEAFLSELVWWAEAARRQRELSDAKTRNAAA
jgi:NAD(P)H-dependent FMN reductase